jgi:hypothetical protein
VAKIIQVTQANGNPALLNADAVTYVITPPPTSVPAGAKAIIYFGAQQLAVQETVADIKALL